MALNIVELPYLIFRLAPIIIVSFFILQSLLMWDLRGILYLCGLIITCIITIFMSNALGMFFKNTPTTTETTSTTPTSTTTTPTTTPSAPKSNQKNYKCRTITLGENGEYYSQIPLNLVVYSFTFFYLLIFILNLANPKSTTVGILNTENYTQEKINQALLQNIPVLVIFPLLIIVEFIWLSINKCIDGNNVDSDYNIYLFTYLLAGIIIGGAGGVAWALMITSVGVPSLQYIISGNSNTCSRPSRTTFRCRPKL